MSDALLAAQELGIKQYPRVLEKHISYGTAGFRTKAEELSHVMYRMGLLAVLRARAKKATIGIMITASHNAEPDNGLKLVDPHGEMLEAAWEVLATELANVPDDQVGTQLQGIVSRFGIDMQQPAVVFVGRDTRSSSPALAKAVIDGVSVLNGQPIDYKLVSTPQLHFFVLCQNTNKAYGEPNEEGYFSKLSTAFKTLRGSVTEKGSYKPTLRLDGANGVGAFKMGSLQHYLGDSLKVEIYNNGDGKLNHLCGADFVKVSQKPPHGLPLAAGVRACSLDGDADRLVYFYLDSEGTFKLLDGDKIATLVAGYLKKLVTESDLDLKLGLVQTAYANGSSTDYITNALGVEVACVPTGVKYLHHKALEFDVGVYFEANGHGTVVFSDNSMKMVKAAAQNQSAAEEKRQAAQQLDTLIDLINQTVGDALSDLLLVETVLHGLGWGVVEWDSAYTDLPNRQLKVCVADRSVIQTTDAERRSVTPAALQPAVDEIVGKYRKGRSFVRPSGTEDIVRVYAEADTQENADLLAYEVAAKVYELAGGVGDVPKPPTN